MMSVYLRNYVDGGTYFFTLATHRRRPILTTDLGRECLSSAIRKIQKKMPFKIFAIVLLPEHLHCVWIMPPGQCNYSLRWSRIKEEFTRAWLAGSGGECGQSESRRHRGYRAIWQKRFWEHTVRDEHDLKRCVDYTHWNPRKHELVTSVDQWLWSSFHRFVRLGEYEATWGGDISRSKWPDAEWGE